MKALEEEIQFINSASEAGSAPAYLLFDLYQAQDKVNQDMKRLDELDISKLESSTLTAQESYNLQIQLQNDPFATNFDLMDAATGQQLMDEIGLNPNIDTYLSSSTESIYAPIQDPYQYQISLLDGNLNVVVDPGVTANIEVGRGGTATIVGGTDSVLYLWQDKNVIWENNGGNNTIDFLQEVGDGLGAPTQGLFLNLETGLGISPFGGTLDVTGVNAVYGDAPTEYIVANNNGDQINAGNDGQSCIAVLIGGTGNDVLTGAFIGKNLIVAGSGTSSLNGNFGDEIFVYNDGVDTINLFEPALSQTLNTPPSILDLTAVQGVTNFAQAIADATQSGANTIFDFGPNQSVTLANVTLGDLSATNFVFDPFTPFVSAPAGPVVAGAHELVTLTVSDAVTVNTAGGTPSLTLNDGGTAVYDAAASDPAGHLLVFDYTVGPTDATPNLEITSVNSNGGVIAAAGGQGVNFADAVGVTLGVQVGTPVTVSAVSVSATGEADTGQELNITLHLNQPVSVALGGTLSGDEATVFGLALNDGAVATFNSSLSNPGSGLLVFSDTVASSDHTADLSITGLLGLTPATGLYAETTVENAGGFVANFTGALADTGLAINPPVYVASISTDAAASPTGFGAEADAGQTFHITLSLNKAVTVNTTGGMPSLLLTDGEIATYDASASTPSNGALVFQDIVGAADHSPSISLSSVTLNGATVETSSGVAASFAGAVGDGLGVAINPSPLSVTSVSASADVVGSYTFYAVTLTMSETIVNKPTVPEEVVLNNGDIAGFNSVSGDKLIFFDSGSSLGGNPTEDANISVAAIETFIGVNPASGATIFATPFLDANGYAANLSGAIGVPTGVTIGDPLYVTALTTNVADGESQGGQPVTIDVGMSEAVTTAGGTPSLTLNDGGTARYDAAASTLASGVIAFTYTPPAGEEFGSVGINSVNLNGATVTDAGGNAADVSSLIAAPLQLQIGPATVVTASSTMIGDVGRNAAMQFILVMSQNVDIDTAGGSPTLTLSDGGTATYDAALTAQVAADSPTSVGQIVFDYTPGSGAATANLSISAVNLNGAVVTDVQSGLPADFSNAANAFLGVTVSCFGQGTWLATAAGEVAVERLAVGDEMRLAGGGLSRVVWLGHRRVDCRRHPRPESVWPVRVAAGAFGKGVPRRELYLSPDHAVFAEGVLVPIKMLVNGASIAQLRCDNVTYWHVELARHDVLLAEGLPCESYLETGCRSAFGDGDVVQMTPDFAPPVLEAVWEAGGYAPLRIAGPAVARLEARLRRRAGVKPVRRKPAAEGARDVDLARLLCADWYLEANPDVAAAGIDAAAHYAGWGRREGRMPCSEVAMIRALGLVDDLTAALTMADVAAAGVDFATHYCAHGWREGRRPNAYFDPRWYAAQAGVPEGVNPLLHYVLSGELQGFSPSKYFAPGWYRERYALPERVCALAHYLLYRRTGWYSPVHDTLELDFERAPGVPVARAPYDSEILNDRAA